MTYLETKNQFQHTANNTKCTCTCMQCAEKVVSDSPGLVDFAVGLVNSVFNLPNRQVKNRRTVKSILPVKKFLGLVKMMSGLVNASFSLPEWQAVKMIFFAPSVCIACHYQNEINYAKDSS